MQRGGEWRRGDKEQREGEGKKEGYAFELFIDDWSPGRGRIVYRLMNSIVYNRLADASK